MEKDIRVLRKTVFNRWRATIIRGRLEKTVLKENYLTACYQSVAGRRRAELIIYNL